MGCEKCSSCFKAGFWPFSGIVIILITTILVAIELPKSSEDPVEPQYNVEKMTDEGSKWKTATLKPTDTTGLNYDATRFLNGFQNVILASDNLLREQYVREWEDIVKDMTKQRDFYSKHYRNRGAQKEELDLFNALLQYFELNKGPYDILNDFAPFITEAPKTSFPSTMDPGHNLYPPRTSRSKWESWMEEYKAVEQRYFDDCSQKEGVLVEAETEYAACLEIPDQDCSSEEEIVLRRKEDVDKAHAVLEDYRAQEALLSLPYAVVGSVPRNEYGMVIEPFNYSDEYRTHLNTIRDKLAKLDTSKMGLSATTYIESLITLHSEITAEEQEVATKPNLSYEIFENNMKSATLAWTAMEDSPIEFLLGPYNFGFDGLTGQKTTWCGYAGIVDSSLTEKARLYARSIENITAYTYRPDFIPNVKVIEVLLEQFGRIGHPKPLALTFPTFAEMLNGVFVGYDIHPKAYVFVNEIKEIYNYVMRGPIFNTVIGGPEKDYLPAYIQLYISMEFARAAGIEFDNGDTVPISSGTEALGYVKSIVGAAADVFEIVGNMSECQLAGTCESPLNCGTELNNGVSCPTLALDILNSALAQLVYVSQFNQDSSPYLKYANAALDYMKDNELIILTSTEDTCMVSPATIFTVNVDEGARLLRELVVLLTYEQIGEPIDGGLDFVTFVLTGKCLAVFEAGDKKGVKFESQDF